MSVFVVLCCIDMPLKTTKKYKTVKLNFVVLKRNANEMLTKNNQKQLKVCYTNQKREKV